MAAQRRAEVREPQAMNERVVGHVAKALAAGRCADRKVAANELARAAHPLCVHIQALLRRRLRCGLYVVHPFASAAQQVPQKGLPHLAQRPHQATPRMRSWRGLSRSAGVSRTVSTYFEKFELNQAAKKISEVAEAHGGALVGIQFYTREDFEEVFGSEDEM